MKWRLLLVSSISLMLIISCGPPGKPGPTGVAGVRGQVGPTGSRGERGPRGKQGVVGQKGSVGKTGTVDPKEVTKQVEAALKVELGALKLKVQTLEKKVASLSQCPTDMITVGHFCIDTFEASVDDQTKLGGIGGKGTTAKALSRSFLPQNDISWFQAARACNNAGKRLCSRQEWLVGAMGTPDSGASPTDPNVCNTKSNGFVVTGSRSQCKSAVGALDMTGNLAEWVDEWHITGAPLEVDAKKWAQIMMFQPWGRSSLDGKDATWGVNGAALNTPTDPAVSGLPVAVSRGGCHENGDAAGGMAFDARFSPLAKLKTVGFRCCRSRIVPVAIP